MKKYSSKVKCTKSMNKVFGYIRVSTAKQGNGVSLEEQREAIINHAEKHDLKVVKWFEELRSAAKQGRPKFNQMMKSLKEGMVSGVIIHKIDRSARNLRDWVNIGDLIDKGVKVHFAHESLDLNLRGGRLAADLQAVIASDYIRNLRDEAIKGLYGRLKQGIYPFGAPRGYDNNGKGEIKSINPIQGPLVKRAFQLYSSGKYTIKELTTIMRGYGLRNSWNKLVSESSIAKILCNPFYIGILKVKSKTFQGAHEPLISSELFQKVQGILKNKTNSKKVKHDFLFKRMIRCHDCGRSLTGEKQKGHVYYRCHTKGCVTKTIRAEKIEKLLIDTFDKIQLQSIESDILNELIKENQGNWTVNLKGIEEALTLQIGNLSQKLVRLTDAYLDSVIEKSLFKSRKENLLIERQGLNQKKKALIGNKEAALVKVEKFFELIKNLKNSYIIGIKEEKRKIIKSVTSNLSVSGRKLMISIALPFQSLLERSISSICPPTRDSLRTCTAHYANMATSGDNYLNCIKISSQMKELLDVIINFFELQDDEKEEC